jgi:2-phospho-L-lactate guanylyltransferase
MFSDVLASLRRAERVDDVAVVTQDVFAEALAHGDRMTVLRDERQDGQSSAALVGIRYAMASDYDRVLLVPGDTPLLDAAEVDALLDRCVADKLAVAIVPDRHGTGTNALVITPPDAMKPSFGPDSLARHVGLATEGQLAYRVEQVYSLAHDVDTPEDLAALATKLETVRTLAPRTVGALRQLERSGAYERNGAAHESVQV